METVDLLTGLAIAVGILGIAVPVMPGTALVAVSLVVWAAVVREPLAWGVAAAGLGLLTVGMVVKYAVPGRRLRRAGVPTRTLVAGGLAAVVGFFVVPVLGLVLGLVGGIYLAELLRLGRAQAWSSTRSALGAVGLSILIEASAALAAAGLWLFGAALT